MANIFSGAVKFLGETLRQVATPDTLKDYAHANRLFVGSNFRLVPKTGFLFHVFFDVNSAIQSAFRTTENQIEMGLMVKNIDLPKFTVDTKVLNSYNRPNLIQSKVRFDSVSMTFHDDSANLVRNFWYDYFRYHYRDSDYTIQRYDMAYKYANEMDMNFGYGPNKDEKPGTVDNYLRAIRIYSLHQKRFSEYILINPIIKSFKHGTHSQGASDLLEHNMIVEYENVLYQEGAVASGQVNGFAQLHYDKMPSPLRQVGGVNTVFGTGGLLGTTGSAIEDFTNGNYGAALFKTARAVNMARTMNVKQAALNELTGVVNATATLAIQEQINQRMTQSYNRTQVPNITTIDGAQAIKFSGIETTSSAITLAGAAILLNSKTQTNRYKSTPILQSTVSKPPSNYNPRLPSNVGQPKVLSGTELKLLNDQSTVSGLTPQVTIDTIGLKQDLIITIRSLENKLVTASNELTYAQGQIANTNTALSGLNTRLSAAQAIVAATSEALATKNNLIAGISNEITVMTNLNNIAQQTVTTKTSETTALVTDINLAKTKLGGLG